jgi:solute carrier family 25 (adenine nucleotide translocator) protein 4/5/6/31
VYPLDFARTRLGVDIGKAGNERQFKGLFDCCGQIFKKDGIQGLYKGFGVSVVGIFTYRAFYFGGYDAGKTFIWGNEQEQRNAPFLMKFLFAQIVTSSSETLAYPLDTIRRRLMMTSGQNTSERLYSGTLDCGRKILATEGVTGNKC